MANQQSDMFGETPFRKVLRAIDARARNTTEKGAMFERLVKAFLENDAVWKDRFDAVWLWNDWPERGNWGDTGVDIVAKNADDDGYTAIQCKFYPAEGSIVLPDMGNFIATSGRQVPDGPRFTKRVFASVGAKWTDEARYMLNQEPPVKRLGMDDFENSSIDWASYDPSRPRDAVVQLDKKTPRAHQVEAIAAVLEGFRDSDRGKLIMACGTGKTFAALRIAEQQTQPGDIILFLAPSITLVSQSIREWSRDANVPMSVHAVCSDAKVGRPSMDDDSGDIGIYDIAAPATTNAEDLFDNIKRTHSPIRRTVIFSTYQSLDVVGKAQENGLGELALVVCDEAHRTAGLTLENRKDSEERKDSKESGFMAVHNDKRIAAKRRLYMTATPRVYRQKSKSRAKDARAIVASMDDEAIFGREFYRYDFARAVEDGNLCDYRVLVFGVDESAVARDYQAALALDGGRSLNEVGSIIASWNAMAKRKSPYEDFAADPNRMRSVVAFASRIDQSKAFKDTFNNMVSDFGDFGGGYIADHVDGTSDAEERAVKLNWLRESQDECRVLSNARCLTEGVDVPALDAVLFLSPRRSQIDVVQAVGRAMRTAPGKKFGYIIIPITVPPDESYEKVVLDSSYNPTFQVLQALKSHDEDFYDTINQSDLKDNPKVTVAVFDDPPPKDTPDDDNGDDVEKPKDIQIALDLTDRTREAIFARIVDSLTDKHYYKKWATETAAISARYEERVRALIDADRGGIRAEFNKFHKSLQRAINGGVDKDKAISLLAQHMVTRPVFDALFSDYEFAKSNPVSRAMDGMVDTLRLEHGTDAELAELDGFYRSVQRRVKYVDAAEKKQRVIADLYQDYFKAAFPKEAESLGIVYTPPEAADFIIRSVENILDENFSSSLSEAGVNILDPFAGTGTFISRLIASGCILPEDLARKYAGELHANEITLLAYYIASVNIEMTFRDIGAVVGPAPFNRMVYGDTFEANERQKSPHLPDEFFAANNERMDRQNAKDIQVIIGNPPWSARQARQNDNNKNRVYPGLRERIRTTYAAASDAQSQESLYDAYIHSIRMASDRVQQSEDGGVVAFVTNGGFIDGDAAAGVRKRLMKEFHDVYCLNLRGHARGSGDIRKREGGNVFGSGSRAGVAILMLVKKPGDVSGGARLHYHAVDDYLTREEKLAYLSENRKSSVAWRGIIPDEHGDWINQRDPAFTNLVPLYGEDGAVFNLNSLGIKTNRDAWVYNFSRDALLGSTARMMDFFNANIPTGNPNWSASDFKRTAKTDQMAKNGTRMEHEPSKVVHSMYRAFSKQHVYFDRGVIERVYQQPRIYPTPEQGNLCIVASEKDKNSAFSCLMTNVLPNLSTLGRSSKGISFYTYRTSVRTGGGGRTGSEHQPRRPRAIPNSPCGGRHQRRRPVPLHLRHPAFPRIPLALRRQPTEGSGARPRAGHPCRLPRIRAGGARPCRTPSQLRKRGSLPATGRMERQPDHGRPLPRGNEDDAPSRRPRQRDFGRDRAHLQRIPDAQGHTARSASLCGGAVQRPALANRELPHQNRQRQRHRQRPQRLGGRKRRPAVHRQPSQAHSDRQRGDDADSGRAAPASRG